LSRERESEEKSCVITTYQNQRKRTVFRRVYERKSRLVLSKLQRKKRTKDLKGFTIREGYLSAFSTSFNTVFFPKLQSIERKTGIKQNQPAV